MKLVYHKKRWFLNFYTPAPLNVYDFLVGFFFGSLIMFMTIELKVLMLCFLYFMDNSIIYTLNDHTFLQIHIN
jgi:hypothetical protein